MTSRNEKSLAKLNDKQRALVLAVMRQLVAGDERGLDIKHLKGQNHLYRARIGTYRIIYYRLDGVVTFVSLTKRDDKTYRDF